jgi:hypothetical protein
MSMDGGDFDGNLQEKKKFGAVKVWVAMLNTFNRIIM